MDGAHILAECIPSIYTARARFLSYGQVSSKGSRRLCHIYAYTVWVCVCVSIVVGRPSADESLRTNDNLCRFECVCVCDKRPPRIMEPFPIINIHKVFATRQDKAAGPTMMSKYINACAVEGNTEHTHTRVHTCKHTHIHTHTIITHTGQTARVTRHFNTYAVVDGNVEWGGVCCGRGHVRDN